MSRRQHHRLPAQQEPPNHRNIRTSNRICSALTTSLAFRPSMPASRSRPTLQEAPLLRVVRREPGVALLGGVHGRDLPGQVLIPVSGADLVQAHHAALNGPSKPQWTGAHGHRGRVDPGRNPIGALTRENSQPTTDETGVRDFAFTGYVRVLRLMRFSRFSGLPVFPSSPPRRSIR
jgi:hypothetical protein